MKNITIPLKFLSRKALTETLSALREWKADTLAAITSDGLTTKESEALARDFLEIKFAIEGCEKALNGVFKE